MDLTESGYRIDIIVTGFPGKAVCHGPLGWSTIALLRGHGHVVLIDVGSFGLRPVLLAGLAEHGLNLEDVTDVLLTHSHYDHAVNWVSFPQARIVIGGRELDWALNQPFGKTVVPELYMRELDTSPRLHRVSAGDTVLPGITVIEAGGHTPEHIAFLLEGTERDVIFAGDAIKNRAELLSEQVDMTHDVATSAETIRRIRTIWERRPGSVLVPGHDLPMIVQHGRATHVGKREAAIKVWTGDDLETTTIIDLASI